MTGWGGSVSAIGVPKKIVPLVDVHHDDGRLPLMVPELVVPVVVDAGQIDVVEDSVLYGNNIRVEGLLRCSRWAIMVPDRLGY